MVKIMNRKNCLNAGDRAPEFSLNDHNEKEFNLSDFKGKRVLLSFHPLAWTTVCAKQMKSLEKNWKEFEDLNTVAVGINVAKLYNIFREKEGFSERANIIINENQENEFVRIYEIGELPDINEILTFLRELE